MKKYFIFAMPLLLYILLAGMMAGCSCDEEFMNQAPDDEQAMNAGSEGTQKQLKKGSDGDQMKDNWMEVPALQSVSAADFKKFVVNHGWIEVQTYEMNDERTQYNSDCLWAAGWGTSSYAIGEETMTGFYYYDHIASNGYREYSMRYDEDKNIIYVDDDDLFTLVSVDETEIHAIQKAGLRDDPINGGMKPVYHYVVLQLMSDEDLQNTCDTYWINHNDIFRPMTREDLFHKWVLMNYTVNHKLTLLTQDRKDDKAYIQFFRDGTIVVKDGEKLYHGTFEGGNINYEDATINLKLNSEETSDSYFLQNVWHSSKIKINAAAYLTLYSEGESAMGFCFQRSPKDY